MAKWSDFETHPVGTADRIKELTTGLANMATRVAEVSEDMLFDRIKELEAQLAGQDKEQDLDVHPVEMAARIKELEAQLAEATALIAELKGQNDE